jgi:hypothetical protein
MFLAGSIAAEVTRELPVRSHLQVKIGAKDLTGFQNGAVCKDYLHLYLNPKTLFFKF